MGFGYSVYSEKGDIIFKHKGPDGGIRKGAKKIVKLFKKENGLCFRLELGSGQWAFYNDTKEYEFHVRYVFDCGSHVEPLGDSTLTVMDDGTSVVEVIVYPLETQMFVEGDIEGGRGRVEARPLSDRYKRESIKRKVSVRH